MLIMTLTRQLNPQARPVTFAVVTEKEVASLVPPDATPDQRATRIDTLMREKLLRYQFEFMEEFIEFKSANFYIDTLELDDEPVDVMRLTDKPVQM
jgi:hypothetical protein